MGFGSILHCKKMAAELVSIFGKTLATEEM